MKRVKHHPSLLIDLQIILRGGSNLEKCPKVLEIYLILF